MMENEHSLRRCSTKGMEVCSSIVLSDYMCTTGMSKMRIGQPQPQHNQPVRNDHNHNQNLTKSHTPTTTSTQFFYDKTPQPQPQPNFFKENTTTQPQHNFSSEITKICGSTTTLPQHWGKNWGHY